MEIQPTTDHAQILLDCMWQLYQDGHFTDVVLVVDDEEEIHVHKSVLVAYSKYFQSQLHCSKHFATKRHTLKNTSRECADALLHFLYCGRLELTATNVWDLLAAATQLQISAVVEQCQRYIESGQGTKDEEFSMRVKKDITDSTYSPKRSSRHRKSLVAQDGDRISAELGSLVKVKTEVVTSDAGNHDSDPEWAPDLDPVTPRSYGRRRSSRFSADARNTWGTPKKQTKQIKSPVNTSSSPAASGGRGRKAKKTSRDSDALKLKTTKPTEPRNECSICSKKFLYFSSLQLHKKLHQVSEHKRSSTLTFAFQPRTFVNKLTSHVGLNSEKGEGESGDHGHGLRKRTRKQTLEATRNADVSSPERGGGESKYVTNELSTKSTFACTICNKQFALYSVYQQHFIRSHRLRFKCRKCPNLFTSRKMLDFHRRKLGHFPEKRQALQCRGCVRRFAYSENLERHACLAHPELKQTSSSGSAPFSCHLCRKRILLLEDFRTHLSLTHTLSYREIDRVTKVLTGRDASKDRKQRTLRTKVKKEPGTPRVTAASKWSCHECGEPHANHKTLLRHMTEEHPTLMYTCNLCRFHSPVKFVLERHVQSTHKALDKTCEICGHRFNKRYFLKIHMYAKHGIEDPTVKVYRCQEPECNYYTFQTNILKQHMRRHQTEKPFRCETCGRCLKTEKSLEKHVNKVHMKIRPYICDQCGMTYGEESELKTHIARHGLKKFQCELCEYSSHDKGNYQSHLYAKHRKTLQGAQKVFSCDICPYTTMRRARFTEHTNSHLNVRPYLCPHCDKSFVTRTTLNGHVKWCHKEKSYRCDFCEYITSTLNHLREHVRVLHTHREVKPYKCFYCDFRCAVSGNCRKHIVNRHKGLDVKWVKICDKYPNNSRPKLSAEDGQDPDNRDPEKRATLEVRVDPKREAGESVKDMAEVQVVVAVPDGSSQVITVKPENFSGHARKRIKRDKIVAQPVHPKSIPQEHMYVQQHDTKQSIQDEANQHQPQTHQQEEDYIQMHQHQDSLQMYQQQDNIQLHQPYLKVHQPDLNIHQPDLNIHQGQEHHLQIHQQHHPPKVDNIRVQDQEEFVATMDQVESCMLPPDGVQMQEIQIPEGIQLDQENLQEILIYREGIKGDPEGGIVEMEQQDSQGMEVQMIQVPSHAESVEIHTEPIHAEIQGTSSQEIHFPAGYQAIEGLLGQQVIIMTPEQAASMQGLTQPQNVQAVISTAATPTQQAQLHHHMAVPTSVRTQFVYQQPPQNQ